jgi:hypothetical protein
VTSGGREGDTRTGHTGVQSLPVTTWKSDDAFHAAFLAPGLEEESINMTIQEDTLSVEGELKRQSPEGARMIWQGFGPRRFERSLGFGTSIDRDRVETTYRRSAHARDTQRDGCGSIFGFQRRCCWAECLRRLAACLRRWFRPPCHRGPLTAAARRENPPLT